MRHLSRKQLKEWKDEHATTYGNHDNGHHVTYYPFLEPVTEWAYSSGVYGKTGSLKRGNISGIDYFIDDIYANDHCKVTDVHMGARELEILEDLDHIEHIQEENCFLLKYVSNGGNTFTIRPIDNGHSWKIVA